MDRNFWPGLSGVWRFLLNCWSEGAILADRKESGMKRSKTVEESVQAMKLTTEEKKIHARLIQECRERESKLVQCRQESEEGIQALLAHVNHLANAIEIIDQHLQEANDRLAEVILRHMPDSRIPHA
jgi:seryl-tRNA synthetase